jgi:hypothetical protein
VDEKVAVVVECIVFGAYLIGWAVWVVVSIMRDKSSDFRDI